MTSRVPVDAKRQDWPRLVANAINDIIGRIEVDPITRTETTVSRTYGDTVSVSANGKQLDKFGRNRAVGTAWETVAELQGTTAEETFVTTNIIDSIVSSSASDTSQTITIEGCTVSAGGALTLVTQDAALNGQTEVTLTTPLARVNKAYIKASGTFGSPPAALVGTVYVYDNTDGITSGVPDTATATKALILPGETQANKCAAAIPSNEYWFITSFAAAIGDATGPTNFANVKMEIRDVENGGAWLQLGKTYTLWPDIIGVDREFCIPYIVPKNHDFRVSAQSDGGTCEIYAEAKGLLAS